MNKRHKKRRPRPSLLFGCFSQFWSHSIASRSAHRFRISMKDRCDSTYRKRQCRPHRLYGCRHSNDIPQNHRGIPEDSNQTLRRNDRQELDTRASFEAVHRPAPESCRSLPLRRKRPQKATRDGPPFWNWPAYSFPKSCCQMWRRWPKRTDLCLCIHLSTGRRPRPPFPQPFQKKR